MLLNTLCVCDPPPQGMLTPMCAARPLLATPPVLPMQPVPAVHQAQQQAAGVIVLQLLYHIPVFTVAQLHAKVSEQCWLTASNAGTTLLQLNVPHIRG